MENMKEVEKKRSSVCEITKQDEDRIRLSFKNGSNVEFTMSDVALSKDFIFFYGLKQILHDAAAMSQEEMKIVRELGQSVEDVKRESILARLEALKEGYAGRSAKAKATAKEYVKVKIADKRILDAKFAEMEAKLKEYEALLGK